MSPPTARWQLIVWCSLTFVVELGALLILALGATLLIAGIRMYYGPWADPPGTDEMHVALMILAGVIAVIHSARRWQRGTVPT